MALRGAVVPWHTVDRYWPDVIPKTSIGGTEVPVVSRSENNSRYSNGFLG